MLYLKLFETEEEKTACTDTYEYVSYTVESDKVNIHPEYDYSQDYLTFVALSDGNFNFNGSLTSNTIQYSTDGGNTWSTAERNVTINVSANDKVLWKGVLNPISNYGIGTFSASTASLNIQGNIMSLLFEDNFQNQTSLWNKGCAFLYLFRNMNVVDASHLILPTTLYERCYEQLFRSCTSLTQVPQLLATTLAYNCYSRMFYGCTSLTTAPELPATTLDSYCYDSMFSGCTNLNHITMLATDISANNCLNNWVNGVATSGTFVKVASMTTLPSGANGIPEGWTVQDA